jgi:hypothetical protein
MASPLHTARNLLPHMVFALRMLPLSLVVGLAPVELLALLRDRPNAGTVLISVR